MRRTRPPTLLPYSEGGSCLKNCQFKGGVEGIQAERPRTCKKAKIDLKCTSIKSRRRCPFSLIGDQSISGFFFNVTCRNRSSTRFWFASMPSGGVCVH